jgi:hypothetical protein
MEHLLEDPDVSGLLEQHCKQARLQYVLKDLSILLIKLFHIVHQLLVLQRLFAFQFLEDILIEAVEAVGAVCLYVEYGLSNPIQQKPDQLLD